MRRAFSEALIQLGRSDPRVIFLTGDLGYQVFDAFREEFPTRYLNVGVAEAQLVNCAAGLALEGWRPLIYSIASFLTGRAFEQIRLALGYHRLPVVVVGAGGGYSYAQSGVTHHAQEDLALMSLIPGLTVTCPGGPDEISALLPQLTRLDGPSYLRVGRFGEPAVPGSAPILVGQGRLVCPGDRVAFLTTGAAVIPATQAAERLAADGRATAVCHFHTLRPFDERLLAEVAGRADILIVAEDHGLRGGLRDVVSRWLVTAAHHAVRSRLRLIGVGPGETLILGNPSLDEVMRRCGLTPEALTETGREAWSTVPNR